MSLLSQVRSLRAALKEFKKNYAYICSLSEANATISLDEAADPEQAKRLSMAAMAGAKKGGSAAGVKMGHIAAKKAVGDMMAHHAAQHDAAMQAGDKKAAAFHKNAHNSWASLHAKHSDAIKSAGAPQQGAPSSKPVMKPGMKPGMQAKPGV